MDTAELRRNRIKEAYACLNEVYNRTKAAGLPDNNAELTAARKNYHDMCDTSRPAPRALTAEEIAAAAAKAAAYKLACEIACNAQDAWNGH